MKYYVYRTTNLINGKEYIGVHKSSNIEHDTYVGSGNLILAAIKKYGLKNFSRDILGEFGTYEDAFELERALVTEDYVKLETNYNIAPGGLGGMGRMKWTDEMRKAKSISAKFHISKLTVNDRLIRGQKAGNTLRGRSKSTHDYLSIAGRKISIKLKHHPALIAKAKQRWIDQREKYMEGCKKAALKNTGKTKENCDGKRRQAEKISGENNPMKRDDVLDKFIGKTKENCEWRLRQSETIKKTQASFSEEKKLAIGRKLSDSLRGERNPMYGRVGELSPVAKYTDAQKTECMRLFQAGMTRKQIASKMNVNYQSLKVWLRGL